ncbi:CDP-glycerol glycerophosphotransferase family protein [Methanobrevibacter sp.]|uniref:CDP-glycerol glycerophosphotransferase family protein n=1 Tax=Methanobrevibacter sp. TaxID=66852 RepID=UPI002E7A6299|nr:CDP-glycerol glycerophosphotransferase family protein [Methanobrevibacter sp.]MEE0940280.1 CDP-glycerol glycerophosphotransferase family protein [Methanobrevibacter sp.]
MSEFKFSVIIQSNNFKSDVEKTLNSLINQTLNFEENIEVIVICNELNHQDYNNIKYIKSESSITLNDGIKYANGEYILFLEANDYISENTLENTLKFIEKNKNVDLITIPMYYYKNGRKEIYLDHRFNSSKTFNLNKNPEKIQIIERSTFIRKDSIKNKFINENNKFPSFLTEILIKNPILGICKEGSYYIENIEEKILPTEEFTFNPEEYEKYIEDNLVNPIKKSKKEFSRIPKFVQYALLNQLKWIATIEKAPEKLDLDKIKKITQVIDDEIILNNILIENEIKLFLFLLKYDNELNDEIKEKLLLTTVFIDIYDIINNELYLLVSLINTRKNDFEILLNNKKLKINEVQFPQYDLYSLGHKFASNRSFEVKIPLSIDKQYEIQFKSQSKQLKIDFSRPCNFSKIVGYAKTQHFLSVLKDEKIIIKKKTALNWIKQELKFMTKMIKNHDVGFLKAIPFRIAYMLSYPILKNKKIWFYMDRPNESDDNGLHLFKYSVQQNEPIDKYFILDSKNRDYDEIKKIGKVIPYKSLKHRFLGLYAENIITSHPDNGIIYPFWGGYPYFAGLLKSNNIFLQHGILKDDISDWLNKKNMNLSFFLVSSEKEYVSIFRYHYNYDEQVIQLKGLPRYDNLQNVEDKHEIIIMPSWRRYLTGKSNSYIEETEYFKRFNSLINNEKLIQKARENNYEIIFRPHPNVYNFIELFDENDYVKIDYEKTKFQTLFNNGSLLVTDYSSVAFDFAYLYKPVIYYQYLNDYHFDVEKSFFNYETMGMGEICESEEELVDLIIDYIENQCKIKEKYIKRTDDFFLFNDKNNCKRVHEAIKEVPPKD